MRGLILLLGLWSAAAGAADPILEAAWAEAQAALAAEDWGRFADGLGATAARDPARVLPYLSDPRRPVLLAAIDACDGHDHPLLIARLVEIAQAGETAQGAAVTPARNALYLLLQAGWSQRAAALAACIPALRALLADPQRRGNVADYLVQGADHPAALPLLRFWVDIGPVPEVRPALAAIARLGDRALVLELAQGADAARAALAEELLQAAEVAGVPPPERGVVLEVKVWQRPGVASTVIRLQSDGAAHVLADGHQWAVQVADAEGAALLAGARALSDPNGLPTARWMLPEQLTGELVIRLQAPGTRSEVTHQLGATHPHPAACAELLARVQAIIELAAAEGDPLLPVREPIPPEPAQP